MANIGHEIRGFIPDEFSGLVIKRRLDWGTGLIYWKITIYLRLNGRSIIKETRTRNREGTQPA